MIFIANIAFWPEIIYSFKVKLIAKIKYYCFTIGVQTFDANKFYASNVSLFFNVFSNFSIVSN